MTSRLAHWETTLARLIEEARDAQFEWGCHDCACWAFGVRAALTGVDVFPFRGRYKTVRGAAQIIRRNGKTLAGLTTRLIGDPLSTPMLAWRGDLLMTGETPALGVCVGPQGAFLLQRGLTFVPLRSCTLAWRT